MSTMWVCDCGRFVNEFVNGDRCPRCDKRERGEQ